MKRIFCVIFALITLSLVSIPLQTKTINTTRTQQIINGLQFDPIYNSYRDSYLRDSFDTLDFVEFQSETDPNRSAEFFQTTVYSNKATSAVFNYACSDVNVFLENSSRFLLDPTYVDYYDIDNVVLPYFIMPRFTSNDPDGYRKCLDLTYQLIHLSNVVDRVYWYYDAVVMSSMGYYNQISYQQALLEKLDVMANFAYRRIQNSIPTGNEADSTAIDYPNGILNTYPGAFWCADGDTTNDYLEFLVIDTNNYMIRMIGALGYAGVILGNQSYLNLVDNLLLTYSGDSNYQWVDEENNNGLLNLVIQKSGMYVEGLQYQNFALSNLFPYFTQRYYYDGFNYYENEIIKQMLKTSSEIMTPEYQFLALDDTLEHHLCHWGWLEYLQLGTDNDLKSSIEWCVNSLINNLPAINSSHVMNGTRDSVFLIESYNGYSVSTVDFPTSLTNGAYANSEVTILRNSVTTQQEFEDNLTVFVNHENSKNYSVHEQSDQNSFLLYYNKNDLLIDPGYYKQWRDGPTWWGWWHGGRLWLNSALAHNTLLFDEDLDNIYIAEQAHILNEYMTTTVYPPLPVVRPIDISSISNTTNTNDQAYRNYLSSANDIDISEIAINYDDLLLQHSRTFIRVDNESVIICDKVQNQSLTSYQFAPQLHFEEYNNTSSTQALSLSNNCFSYSSEHPDQYLYGSIGANTAATLAIHDNLPWGLNSDTTYRYHKALRLTTAATLDDAEFITILCPSDNSTSSILAEETSNIDAYGVKYDTNTIDSFESYTALKNSGTTFDFTVDQLRFNTNGKIFLTKANSTFSDFDKLAICNGNYLEVSDLTSSGFGNVSVFEGTDVDNVIATWADGNLEVVIKNDTAANPKYKVLRSSTDLENFT
ncbi:MAG: heparinase II/III family protein, partial [Candidatus Zophobacter franzmannii]|nr:heparinase II/III family protein [Candidatus Zophobacter franzmannii]